MKAANKLFFPLLLGLLFITVLASIGWGAVSIAPSEMLASLFHFFKGEKPASIYEGVFLQLRLPRVLIGLLAGAVLAVSGVLMQGLFRNPIVEPGLAGTSAGAALGASVVFVLSAGMAPEIKAFMGNWLVPLFAFTGGLLSTYTVYALSKQSRAIPILSLLLVGMAINALCLSGTGFMSYLARDPQARSITFWNLGTLSGGSWWQVMLLYPPCILAFVLAYKKAKHLNALMLGEEEAYYMGVDTGKLKKRILLLNTLMVSLVTACIGVISFVGLIVPHILRQVIGSDHKRLVPAAALSGGVLLLLADLGARLLLAPAEIPIGIITSIVGAPVFILLLKKNNFIGIKSDGHA